MRNGNGSSERTVTPFIRYAGKTRMIFSIFWTPEIISAWMTDPEKLFCIMPVIRRFCTGIHACQPDLPGNEGKRDYFAVVLDEYGCFVGIVTLHDLVETLVGDIDDRTDLPKPDDIEKIGEHIWKIQGGAILMMWQRS